MFGVLPPQPGAVCFSTFPYHTPFFSAPAALVDENVRVLRDDGIDVARVGEVRQLRVGLVGRHNHLHAGLAAALHQGVRHVGRHVEAALEAVDRLGAPPVAQQRQTALPVVRPPPLRRGGKVVRGEAPAVSTRGKATAEKESQGPLRAARERERRESRERERGCSPRESLSIEGTRGESMTRAGTDFLRSFSSPAFEGRQAPSKTITGVTP